MKDSSSNPTRPGLVLVQPGAILFGVKCSECGSQLYAPRAGFAPSVCGATCRQRKRRRLLKAATPNLL